MAYQKSNNYRDILLQFAQQHGCKFEEFCCQLKTSHYFSHEMKMYSLRGDWIAYGKGSDLNQTKATSRAIEILLSQVMPHFTKKKDHDFLMDIYLKADFAFHRLEQPDIRRPEKEHDQDQQQKKTRNTAKQPAPPKTRSIPQKKMEFHPSEVVFDGDAHTLYICKSESACRRKGHSVESVTGILASVRGTPIKINVNYCDNCRMYFIGYQEYQHYIDFYGPLLGNIVVFVQDESDFDEQGFRTLAKESILKICGYTVRQGELTEDERRCILANIIDRKIASKGCVMEHLQSFINRHHNQSNRTIAVSKWRDDLDWVRNYHINTQRRFIITGVRHA